MITLLPQRLPNAADLHDLFNQGELGNLIAEKFNGTCGDRPGNQDSYFLIIFESEESVPEGLRLAGVILEHYTALGYTIQQGEVSRDKYCAHFHAHGHSGPVEFVAITKTLHEQKLKALQITTTFTG